MIETHRPAGKMADIVEEFWDLATIEALYRRGLRVSPEDFRDALHRRFEQRGRLILTGSARHALNALLRRAARGSGRRRVMLSSYNCRAVKDAVVKAGLEVDVFDLATSTGGIDWERVGASLGPQHLAVVVPHLFGIPTDFAALLPAARRAKVLVVEDCAHTLGATVVGATAGQLGDASVFSFNYDKPLSLAGGGALLINDPAIDIDARSIERAPSKRVELRQFRQLASALERGRQGRKRSLWAKVGIKLHVGPHALPRLPAGIGPLRAAAGLWQLERYDEVRRQRDANARWLLRSLSHLAWHVGDNVTPAYLKLRVVVAPDDAASAVRKCREQGITVANSNWPRPIGPSQGQVACDHAFHAATFGLEIPVHQNLSSRDLAQIASAFREVRAYPMEEPGRPHAQSAIAR